MGLLRGVGEPADSPVFRYLLRGKAEGQGILVTPLHLHFGKINAPGIDARGRAGLKAAQGQTQPRQSLRQGPGGVHPVGAGVLYALPHNGAPL